MSTKNFTQFDTAAPLTSADYIVGYKANGSAEYKATVKQVVDLTTNSLPAFVESDSTVAAGASAVSNIVTITQVAYDAIVTKDLNTVYIII
jgi:hypothetical protein